MECELCTLPLVNGRKKHRWKDEVLNNLCAQSKYAWEVWIEAGRPSSRPEFDEKCRLRRKVRKKVRSCAAKVERLKLRPGRGIRCLPLVAGVGSRLQ